ncbi:tubulin-folding cofactor B-like isoform X2 [Triticum urartu]|uniref:Ubiquitin-like domain-containing protein n=1 Tax=Triticum urartu TaxID=4572 RepID=A0A8R7NZ92_TRIUA|nr:tubulin-folding cofactor B-like isoform X2 [Triticum urartu]XP_048574430.1 tubulin-folding cofactor B-like isoform X2 [Triticum urartu]XP_048574436.1 tubulin-folding cofactor B-like isoform X2 [Triticum urartu]XP_048574442.1 tubulin-folding cofactor B-like isoform X2 [Triticum urartu]
MAVGSMRLELRDEAGARVADLGRDAAPLAAYSPYVGYRLHVIDLDPSSVTSGGWLEDTSFVDKYTMSDDAYDELGTNIRKFKEKMVSKNLVSDDKQSDNQMEELCANIKGLGVHQILARTATAASVCICRVHERRTCFCLDLFSGVSSAAAA